MKKKILTLFAIVLTLVGGVTVVVLIGNDYRITEERLTIDLPGRSLDAVLARPRDSDPTGLVVMVHGDGPVEATHDGLYRPWFEAAADAGFATLSWTKPGNWLSQTMDDRAHEVEAAIDWARARPDIPTRALVLWGASQAGWVLPKVAAARNDLTGIVAVSPAINWLRQGRYNLLAELRESGATPEDQNRAVAASNQTRELLTSNADYATYRAHTPDPMDAARWTFVKLNYRSDATADLTAAATRHLPTLLMLATHDLNVDITETATTYQRILGQSLTTKHFNAAHSMARPIMETSKFTGLTTATLWPRSLLAPGVLDTYRTTLTTLH
ncbi:alpha/beta hydrolase family protein [Actinoplanes sp. NPDC048988]|uniref:alpha/beta hydrolase family protein n=1 Tax=Actinoplanes sp. NPDC048988 TaxID=3363901 RepID=UPI00371E6D24